MSHFVRKFMGGVSLCLAFLMAISEPVTILAAENVSVSVDAISAENDPAESSVSKDDLETDLYVEAEDEDSLADIEMVSEDEAADEEDIYSVISDLNGESISGDAVRELTSYREEYSKSFIHSDHSVTVATYPQAVHYEKDGTWIPIDNTLRYVAGKENGYINTSNSFRVHLSEYADSKELLSISEEEGKISLSYINTLKSPVVTDLDGEANLFDFMSDDSLYHEQKMQDAEKPAHTKIRILQSGTFTAEGEKEKGRTDEESASLFSVEEEEHIDETSDETSAHDLYALPEI